MSVNIGTLDRAFRFVLGLVLLAAPFISGLAIFESTTATVVAVIAGIVLLGTSAMRFCLLYRILGVGTCKI